MVHQRYMLSVIMLLLCLACMLQGGLSIFAEAQSKTSDVKSKTINDGLEGVAAKRDKNGIVHIDQSNASKLLLSKPDKRAFNGELKMNNYNCKNPQSFFIHCY